MTTAPGLFRRIDHQAGRLEAFADATQHFPGVIGVSVDYDDDAVEVLMEGHKTAIPMPMRDMAKALCLTIPDEGSTQVEDSDDVTFTSNYHGPRTRATFRLGGAILKNQR